MRLVVAVKAPEHAQAGGAGQARLAQTADQRPMHRPAVVLRPLGAVDHQLRRERAPVLVLGRQPVGNADRSPVALAHSHALKRHQRLAQQLDELRQGRLDSRAVTDRQDHHRDLGVARPETRALPPAPAGAVDAEPRVGTGDTAAVQQIARRHEGRLAADALPAPEVDGELGRLTGLDP